MRLILFHKNRIISGLVNNMVANDRTLFFFWLLLYSLWVLMCHRKLSTTRPKTKMPMFMVLLLLLAHIVICTYRHIYAHKQTSVCSVYKSAFNFVIVYDFVKLVCVVVVVVIIRIKPCPTFSTLLLIYSYSE